MGISDNYTAELIAEVAYDYYSVKLCQIKLSIDICEITIYLYENEYLVDRILSKPDIIKEMNDTIGDLFNYKLNIVNVDKYGNYRKAII